MVWEGRNSEIGDYKYTLKACNMGSDNIIVELYSAQLARTGRLFFIDDSQKLPAPTIHISEEYVKELVYMYYWRSFFPQIIDMLRNEKPLYLRYYVEKGTNRVMWPSIGTTKEPIGEEEQEEVL